MNHSPQPNKNLGQHWLHDETTLAAICDAADIEPDDTVLEVGPGLGTLTEVLVGKAKQVVAVEFDRDLARDLPGRVPEDNLEVINADILKFDVTKLPFDYKVVANVPYYITSKITRFLLEATNPPKTTVLLVQKEVAERMAAKPGDMSILAIAVQYYCEATLGLAVPAKLFTPPPKVDSQVIVLKRRPQKLYPDVTTKEYFAFVRAGFGEKRKKLRNSLSGGLRMEKTEVDDMLSKAGVPSEARAEELSLDDWYKIIKVYQER